MTCIPVSQHTRFMSVQQTANVEHKNIATLIGELPKSSFIRLNRRLLTDRITGFLRFVMTSAGDTHAQISIRLRCGARLDTGT